MVQPYFDDDVSDYEMSPITDEEDYESECKAVSTGYIRSDFTVVGAVTCLNRIQLGTMAWNRIGRSIKLTALAIRGEIQGGSNIACDFLRFLVVYDRQCNGTTPVAADILKDFLANGTTQTNSTSSLNLANAGRFKVIADISNRSWLSTPSGLGHMDPNNRMLIDTRIPFRDARTQYKRDSVPALASDIETGSLWLLTIGKETNGTYGFYGTFTVEYDDL